MTTLIEAALIASTLAFKKSWEENGDTRYILSELDLEITETSGGEVLLEGQNIQAFVADLLKTLNRPASGPTDQLLSSSSVLLLQDMRATLYKREDTRKYHICRETQVGKRVPQFSESPPLPNLPLAMLMYVETLEAGMKATAVGMAGALEQSAQKLSSGFAGENPMDLLKSIFTQVGPAGKE